MMRQECAHLPKHKDGATLAFQVSGKTGFSSIIKNRGAITGAVYTLGTSDTPSQHAHSRRSAPFVPHPKLLRRFEYQVAQIFLSQEGGASSANSPLSLPASGNDSL